MEVKINMFIWNPWHGCKRISSGCLNCYVYRRDSQFGKDSSIIEKTNAFDLPLKKNKQNQYKLSSKDNPIYVCLTSDFFIEEADEWRKEIWKIMKSRKDLYFKIITKRIIRFYESLPDDWANGYNNVSIICTCENQKEADTRLPFFINLPILHKEIIHEPMLEKINIEKYLSKHQIEQVICGGESGENARLCDFDWILNTREQCISNNISFYFKQTGSNFKMNHKIYHIPRKYQLIQADKADINFTSFDIHHTDEYDFVLGRLAQSKFRSNFSLNPKEEEYYQTKGSKTIRSHAYDFIRKRLAPAHISNDGKQTPTNGHPVFVAQHATACCCRSCLQKWHSIPQNRSLTNKEIDYIVNLIMVWLDKNSF